MNQPLKAAQSVFFSRRTVIILLALVSAWLLISYLGVDFVMQRRLTGDLQRNSVELKQKSDGVAAIFEQTISRLNGLPNMLAQYPLVKSALRLREVTSLRRDASYEDKRLALSSHPLLIELNHFLALANKNLGDDKIWIIDSSGDCFASSNFDQSDSLVGVNYADRLYFKIALAGQQGKQYVVGRLSSVGGFIFSAPIYEKGAVIGVVASKINTPDLAQRLNLFNSFITDAAGVIVLSSNKNLESFALNNAEVFKMSSEEADKQYKRHQFTELKVEPGRGKLASHLISIFPGDTTPQMLSRHPQDRDGYTVHTFAPLDAISRYHELTLQFTSLLFFSGAAVIFLVAGLRRYLNDRQKALMEIHRLNADLEQRVIDRTAELQASNKELESFCYTVSHDLRAPLRHLDCFVDMLVSRCRDGLSKKGLHYVDVIAASARQMGTLIDNLLQFSRIGRVEMRREKVDMNQIFQETLASILECNSDRTIEWVIGDLPSVRGDTALLRQVWANLLENAVKYTATRENVRIDISAKMEKEEIIFMVADNGVGFDMKYVGKLFGVFQRLHHVDEFEGTGIGLATVQRIISRHGGRVWAEGELDRGAQIYFALPN